jgi:thymidylate kinase
LSGTDGPKPLLVEFIGATGAGKSTLLAATAALLAERGFRVCQADEAILARYRLNAFTGPRVRAVLVHALALLAFWRYAFTREGRALSRLALRAIRRDAGGAWIGTGLLRNYMKRVGSHVLLERLRGPACDCDFVLCDEGIVHAAHNLFVHAGAAPREEEIVLFAAVVPKPDVLIWVTAPAAQSAAVILQRGHRRVAGTPQAAAFAEHAQRTFDLLTAAPAIQARTHRVDNAGRGPDGAEATIRARAQALGEFLQQQAPRPPRDPAPRAVPVGPLDYQV